MNVPLPGTTVLDASDPSGDDNGPGTYQYPTSGDFAAGLVRPHPPGGQPGRDERLHPDHAPHPGSHVRKHFRCPAARRLRPQPDGEAASRPPPPSRRSTTRSRRRTPGASGSRPKGSRRPVWVTSSGASQGGTPQFVADGPSKTATADRAAVDVRHGHSGMGVHGGADRSGRLQPRSGTSVHLDGRRVHVRRVRPRATPQTRSAASIRAAVPEGDGHDPAVRRFAGHRARSDAGPRRCFRA